MGSRICIWGEARWQGSCSFLQHLLVAGMAGGRLGFDLQWGGWTLYTVVQDSRKPEAEAAWPPRGQPGTGPGLFPLHFAFAHAVCSVGDTPPTPTSRIGLTSIYPSIRRHHFPRGLKALLHIPRAACTALITLHWSCCFPKGLSR